MAFTFKNIKGISIIDLSYKLENAIAKSRFFLSVIKNLPNKITIHNVRLKEKKNYCGNHPFACPIRKRDEDLTHKQHLRKNYNFLEGADWVAFNDLCNDILDKFHVSADVASSLCVIRKGDKRCVKYDGHKLGNGNSEWNKEGVYQNKIGVKTKSEFPDGTPGITGYK